MSMDYDKQKEHIADLYHRVAPTMVMLDRNSSRSQQTHGRTHRDKGWLKGIGCRGWKRGHLFPAAEKAVFQGEVIGIDIAEGMVRENDS